MAAAVGEASEERPGLQRELQAHKHGHFQTGLYSMCLHLLSRYIVVWMLALQPGHWIEITQAEENRRLSHPSFCHRICERPFEQNSFTSLSAYLPAPEVGGKHLLDINYIWKLTLVPNKIFVSVLHKQFHSHI